MSKVLVNETSLTGIADAIRGKNGTSATYKPSEMAAAIIAIPTGGGSGESGDGLNFPSVVNIDSDTTDMALNTYGTWDWLLSQLGETQFNFNNGGLASCFNGSELEDMSHLTLYANSVGGEMFRGCRQLKQLPKIYTSNWYSGQYTFFNCNQLREIPSDFFACRDKNGNLTGQNVFEYNPNGNAASMTYVFNGCCSLRGDIPIIYPRAGGTNLLANLFYNCFAIDQITNIPVGTGNTAITSNKLSSFVNNLWRVKDFMFATQEDGTAYSVRWKAQTIDLATKFVGYCANDSGWMTNYNHGITVDKKVTDEASYQALKNDPDWWTYDYNYSRYNHDSAVNTINSLPDASAYLATQSSGTNTIKFKGASGTNTDGGAISNLTEEEIAVATAKGWTVTLV